MVSGDPKVVPIAGTRRGPDPARVREFAAAARKLQQERAASTEAIAALLSKPLPDRSSALLDTAALRTTGAVDRITLAAAEQLERDPQHALALSELATTLAGELAADDYPPVVLAQVRAHAWKTRAQSHLYIRQLDDAMAALDRAEALLAPFGTVAHDLALVHLTRALVLQRLSRFEESLTLIAGARRVFFDHRDLERCVDAGMSEGILLYRMRKFGEAREVFATLLEPARELADAEQLARLHNNLGHCCVSLEELDAATTHLSRAAALFTELGRHVEALRAELSSAELAARRGDRARALARLGTIRTSFAAHGLHSEAGFCAIEMVELLVHLGRTREAVALACSIDDFSRTAYRDGAREALAHLERQLNGDAPLDGIAYVRSLLRGLVGSQS